MKVSPVHMALHHLFKCGMLPNIVGEMVAFIVKIFPIKNGENIPRVGCVSVATRPDHSKHTITFVFYT